MKKKDPIFLLITIECLPCQPRPASHAQAFSRRGAESENGRPSVSGLMLLIKARSLYSFFLMTS